MLTSAIHKRSSKTRQTLLQRNGFDATTPGARAVLSAFHGDLDNNNHLLHCAYEMAEIVAPKHAVTDAHRREQAELAFAVNLDSRYRRKAFYDQLPAAGPTATEGERRRCFWIRYCWLAGLAVDMDELNLLVEEPPNWSGDSYRSHFWKSKLADSPLPCTNSAMTMCMRLEREHNAFMQAVTRLRATSTPQRGAAGASAHE